MPRGREMEIVLRRTKVLKVFRASKVFREKESSEGRYGKPVDVL